MTSLPPISELFDHLVAATPSACGRGHHDWATPHRVNIPVVNADGTASVETTRRCKHCPRVNTTSVTDRVGE